VNNENEEEYYAAQGYEPAGKIDPSAWVRAHSDAPPADYVPQPYPRWRDGVLYMTAQEDPGADPADLVEKPIIEWVSAPDPAPTAETDALKAQLAVMNEQMAKMAAQLAATQAQPQTIEAEAPITAEVAVETTMAPTPKPIAPKPAKRKYTRRAKK
jgi:hypothetical protein